MFTDPHNETLTNANVVFLIAHKEATTELLLLSVWFQRSRSQQAVSLLFHLIPLFYVNVLNWLAFAVVTEGGMLNCKHLIRPLPLFYSA